MKPRDITSLAWRDKITEESESVIEAVMDYNHQMYIKHKDSNPKPSFKSLLKSIELNLIFITKKHCS